MLHVKIVTGSSLEEKSTLAVKIRGFEYFSWESYPHDFTKSRKKQAKRTVRPPQLGTRASD